MTWPEKSKQRGQFKKGDPRTVETGRKGGLKARGGGFRDNPEFAREAGRKGGKRRKELGYDNLNLLTKNTKEKKTGAKGTK